MWVKLSPFAPSIPLVFTMTPQSIIPDFWEKTPTQTTKPQLQLSYAYGSLPQRQTPDSSHPPHYTQKSKSRRHQSSGSESRPEHHTQTNESQRPHYHKQTKPTRGSITWGKFFLLFRFLNSQNTKEYDNHV